MARPLAQALAHAERPNETDHSHEILLPVRQGGGGRSALLQQVRSKLRRKALPAPAPELPVREGLFPMRLPRTFPAAGGGLHLVEGPRISRESRLRHSPRLSHACRTRSASPSARGAGRARGLQNPRRAALVGLEFAAGMDSQAHQPITATEGKP